MSPVAIMTASDSGIGQESAKLPLGRTGYAREIAAWVVFLASEKSSYATVASLVVDGGLTLMAAELISHVLRRRLAVQLPVEGVARLLHHGVARSYLHHRLYGLVPAIVARPRLLAKRFGWIYAHDMPLGHPCLLAVWVAVCFLPLHSCSKNG